MYEYEEDSDIIGLSCTLLNPYKGYTEGTIVGDYGNTIVVRLESGKEISEYRDEVIIHWLNDNKRMTQIAAKFVKWDIPELATLQDSKVYKLRVHLNVDTNWKVRQYSSWKLRHHRISIMTFV